MTTEKMIRIKTCGECSTYYNKYTHICSKFIDNKTQIGDSLYIGREVNPDTLDPDCPLEDVPGVKKDLAFLKEMRERFEKAVGKDTTQIDYVRVMINDWIDELDDAK